MSSRYLVVKAELRREPEVAIQTDEIETAITTFKESAIKALDSCIILYDSQDDKVCRVFMVSEPIRLVKAIELARISTNNVLFPVRGPETKVTGDEKSDESQIINLIVEKLSNPSTTRGNRDFDMDYTIEPYYAFELNGGGVAGAAGGFYGALSGAALGFFTGGPPGAFFGGLLGGFGLGTGTKYLFNTIYCPYKCEDCRGSGLKGNNFRCRNCLGYGYTEEKI